MTFLVSVNVLDTESFIALYIAMGALFFNDPIRNLISLMFATSIFETIIRDRKSVV